PAHAAPAARAGEASLRRRPGRRGDGAGRSGGSPMIASRDGRHARSKELYERACRVLAGGVSSEFRKSGAPHPLFYSEGKGSHVRDVDDNDYLDFTLSQGPLILGHAHPEV